MLSECQHLYSENEMGRIYEGCRIAYAREHNTSTHMTIDHGGPGVRFEGGIAFMCRGCTVPKILQVNNCAHLVMSVDVYVKYGAKRRLNSRKTVGVCSATRNKVKSLSCIEGCSHYTMTI